jgi:hypothetical protein
MWIHLLTLALISGANGTPAPPVNNGDGGGYVIKGSKASEKPWWRKPAPLPEPLPRVAQKQARAIVKAGFKAALKAEISDADISAATQQFKTLAGQFWRLQLQVVAEFNRINEESAAIALLLL